MSDAEQLTSAAPGIAPDPLEREPVSADATRPVARRRSAGGKRRAKTRKRHTVLKVLLTTGYASESIERHGADAQFPVLDKPYRHDELARKVRIVLDGATGVS